MPDSFAVHSRSRHVLFRHIRGGIFSFICSFSQSVRWMEIRRRSCTIVWFHMLLLGIIIYISATEKAMTFMHMITSSSFQPFPLLPFVSLMCITGWECVQSLTCFRPFFLGRSLPSQLCTIDIVHSVQFVLIVSHKVEFFKLF